ncbi:MAG: hypothetical protein HYY05_04600 [Chloroflexi bacterium]|nr:hypothetical protein [Chloroflexota bacterium]
MTRLLTMHEFVVLLDVDNTLLDNDLVRADLERDLAGVLGGPDAARFWEVYEEVRAQTDLVNFPETLERFARECADPVCVSRISAHLYEFPFLTDGASFFHEAVNRTNCRHPRRLETSRPPGLGW